MNNFQKVVISGNTYGFTDLDAIHSLSGYATEQWVENYTYDKQTIDDKISSGGGSSSAITVLSGDVITISGDVVELSQDVQNISGDVVTISGDVSGLETKLDTLSGKVDDKQDKLIAGQGISISNSNVISTSGSVTEIGNGWDDIFGHNLYIIQYGGENAGPKNIAKSGEGIIINRESGEPSTYTGVIRCDFNTVQRKLSAGTGIDITDNVISTVTKTWCGTQAEYDAISVKDPNTIYLIHD